MALKIEWTAEAEDHLDNIFEYLEGNWTQKEMKQFFQKLDKGLETISQNPLQHKKSLRKENAREYQITKHTTLFYDFDKEKATVLMLWSNAMNPDKL